MKSVTIVGLGWLGKACADDLHQNGYLVKATKRKSQEIHSPYPVFEWSLSEKFPSEAISDTMIICIAEKEHDVIHYQHLFQELIHVEQIIFISTTAVYEGLSGCISEDTTLEVNSLAHSKEMALMETGASYLILRLAGLVGPNRNPARFLAGRKEVQNPNQKVNLVHQTDVINILKLALQKNTKGIVNVCSSEHPSRVEFYSKVCAYHGYEPPMFAASETEPVRWINNEKSKEVFNYKYIYDNLLNYYLSENSH